MARLSATIPAVFIGMVVAGFAQQPPGDLAISGVVVNSLTGEPVKRALLQLGGSTIEGGSGRRITLKTLTDAAGGFQFLQLPKGFFYVSIRKPGFSFLDPTENFELKASMKDMRLRITPAATIHGKVTTSEGEPAARVVVELLSSKIEDGLRKTVHYWQATTDDRGLYRLPNISAGTYLIRVSGMESGAFFYKKGLNDADAFFLAPQPVYLGQSDSEQGATKVDVSDGRHVEANLTVTFRRAVSIRGKLTGAPSAGDFKLELFDADGKQIDGLMFPNLRDSKFEIQGVIPGSYLIRGSNKSSRGELAVQVGSNDLENLELIISSGVTITGVVKKGFTESQTQVQPSNKQQDTLRARLNMTNCSGLAIYSSTPPSERYRAHCPTEGQIEIKGVLPGRYKLDDITFGRYVALANYGTVDLLTGGEIIVDSSGAVQQMELLLKEDSGIVEGTIQRKDGGPVPSASVILVPARIGGSPKLYHEAGSGGSFNTGFIPPGDYTAYAFASILGLEYANPAVLSELGQGTRVTVSPNGKEKITLKLIERQLQ